MARRRRLTPAQPGYLAPVPDADETSTGAAARAPLAPIAQVSGQSAEAAALRELEQGIQAARDEGRMVVDVPLGDVAPGHLMRDRIVLDREELDALKASIRAHGQRIPAEITPLSGGDDGVSPHRFGLISGWRRLTVLNELHAETGEARFSTLRALIRPAGAAAEAYVAMVEENEIRVGLSYYERARLVAELTRRGVFPDQSSALRTLFASASRAKRSKIGSFVELVDALGDVLRFPSEIPERLGLAVVSRLRLGGKAEIRAALAKAAPADAAAEAQILDRLAKPAAPAAVSRAKHLSEVVRPGVHLKTARKGGRLTVTLSGDGLDDALLDRVRAVLSED